MKADWCRLWHDLPTDPKWRTIAKRANCSISEVIAVFSFALVNASSSEQRGSLQGWSDEDVASALDIETETVTSIREAMQGRVLDGDHLTGWERRQPKREDEGAAERKRRSRAKPQEISRSEQDDVTLSHDVSRTVTANHARGEERREEKKEKEDNNRPTDENPEPPESGSAASRRSKSTSRDYAFQARHIRLTRSDFDQWQQAFSNLNLEAELLSLDRWAGEQGKGWFHAVSAALAKRNREEGARLERVRTEVAVHAAGGSPHVHTGYGDSRL